MTGFLSAIWNAITAVKNAIGNVLLIAILVAIVVAVVSTETVTVPDSAALIVNPAGVIVEQRQSIDPVAEFLAAPERRRSETLLRDILEAIEAAAEDDRIESMVLDLSGLRGATPANLEDIGRAISAFRQTGKPVFAFGQGFDQRQYYLAAHADKIYLDGQTFNPVGGVVITGYGVYPMFYKDALENLKIQMHIFRAGLYKGAVEPFLRNDMSEEAREANAGWIGVLWDHYRQTVTTKRNMSVEAFDRFTNQFDQLLVAADTNSSQLAIWHGLVDEMLTRKQWRERMQELVGESGDDSYNHIDLNSYLAATRLPIPDINPTSDKVAVITAQGTILDGSQPAGSIGSESMVKLIRQARNDDQVKAIVVRIDSPGGSASASELIRSELEITQTSGKPVVVSMAGYAASGGYWIASTANKIYASATTVTGSIGVFALFPTFEESIAELGVHADGVGTTALSGSFDPFQSINPALARSMEVSVKQTYIKFLSLVARGRNMSVEQVDDIGQGRVWAGLTALDLGLVDSMGNLDDAVSSAANLASLSDYDVIHIEKPLSTSEQLVREILNNAVALLPGASGTETIQNLVPLRFVDTVAQWLKLIDQSNVVLQCLYCRVSD